MTPRDQDTRPTGQSTPELQRIRTVAQIIIAFAVVLFLLVQARFLLISLATAIILFSLTSDAITSIARVRLGPVRVPNWLASIVALLLISAALLSLSAVILSQINTVLSTTLAYTDRAPQAISAMVAWLGPDAEEAVFNAVSTLDVAGYLRALAGQAGGIMQGTVLVILFVGFLFAERIWFTTKLESLFGDAKKAERVGRIISSIIHRVNYYLLVKTLVSVVTGLMVYGVAQFFALDLAGALGILTFVLNYIPSIGSIVATVLVALVAYVQLADGTTALVIFLIVGIIQFINGNIIDPMLMGRALRVSSFGIIISLAFWAAVWGIPGMFLAVPIMVALMIVCSHVPGFRAIAVLLSREGLPETDQDLDAPKRRRG
ncbi:AI-2 transport protein TqsA [Roseovarius sp. EC-HK134]|uniref:AI-2 transport protein TqsA n=1 Tax=Roseovarius mucosus TaxID=215743 RepID=A0A1V0RIX3_9RHOB|nr:MULTISPECIES: AI-2E family transporter [Roseovarius]ARE81595.1 AI-2 transport protein TqsA [Roseovarius mucosus]AWZ21640.1 Transporter, permease [Roseovarius sp. AK1035]VVT29428.1 AI-2 transport protein TqsA [Roseovarius sp. EC-SD190]VVT30499.1 AI-2 transport protein TqsA [Roseovarius sp. EC-HK134]